MKSPWVESALEGARLVLFAVVGTILTLGVDSVAKAMGYDITNERVVVVITLITAVLKVIDKGSHVANKNADNGVKGLAPF